MDGRAVNNNLLIQFQSDILGVEVERPQCIETTALGVAYLAGLATGFWCNKKELKEQAKIDRTFKSQMEEKLKEKYYQGWKKAVKMVMV